MEDPLSPPEGTVTLLFTDIEGSTRLLQYLGERYPDVLEQHRRLLRGAFGEWGGHELGTEGDAFFVAFPHAPQALAAAVAAQRALAAHPWPAGAPVRVRMGLHTGEPTCTAGEYVGLDVHRAARIRDAAHGGQILLSQRTRDLLASDLPPDVSVRDLGAHRLKDLQAPEHLFQLVLADQPEEFPPPRSLEAVAHNLPIQLTRFIGRDAERAAVQELLGRTRLLTLTGVGGCGKTRLALQVAADLVEAYGDGVWLVELAALTDPALVPQEVASALGVREEPGRPLGATLTDHLRSKQLLLVLDNCEHLVGACAALADRLLRASPGLQILATSREVLGVRGERTYRVPSLSLPDPQQLPPLEELPRYDAVRLFVERALESQPAFAATLANTRAVVEVCRRLDGIPLALELAAARLRVLPVEQVRARLDDRFRLLTGGSRTVLPRQQALRAAIDWSYELLTEGERVLLRRLSVFAGGWTLEAAEAVCASEGIEDYEVLDLLARLVDKSLVLVEEHGGEARYRLLETIRQYGHDRLKESGEAIRWRRWYLDWFLGLAERAEPELEGPEQEEWLRQLEQEHENLRAALEYSLESDPEVGLRLAGALWHFWEMRGYPTEGQGWLERALAAASSAPTALRAKALTGAGTLAWVRREYGRAKEFHSAALSLYRALGDRRGIAFSLHNLATQFSDEGDWEQSVARLEESLAISRELGEKRLMAYTLNNLGMVALDQADYERARMLFEEDLAVARELGDQWLLTNVLENVGEVARCQGNLERALMFFKESLPLRLKLKDKRGIACCLFGFAAVASTQGDYIRAARLFGAEAALCEAIGVPHRPADSANRERHVTHLKSMLGEAAFGAAWAEGRALTLEQAIASVSGTGDHT